MEVFEAIEDGSEVASEEMESDEPAAKDQLV